MGVEFFYRESTSNSDLHFYVCYEKIWCPFIERGEIGFKVYNFRL